MVPTRISRASRAASGTAGFTGAGVIASPLPATVLPSPGPLGRAFRARSRKVTLDLAPCGFGLEQLIDGLVAVDDPRLVLEEGAGVGGRTVGREEVVAEEAKIGGELAAMVGGVGDAAHEDPGARAVDVEEAGRFLEPGVGLGG